MGAGERSPRRQRSSAPDTIRPLLYRPLVHLVRPAHPGTHALAHPDESSRPLSTAPSTTSTTQTPQTAAPVLRVTLALFALSLVACLLTYVVLATPGKWFPSIDTKRW